METFTDFYNNISTEIFYILIAIAIGGGFLLLFKWINRPKKTEKPDEIKDIQKDRDRNPRILK